MPQLDIRRKYTHGYKKKKKQKSDNFFVGVLSGIFPWKDDTGAELSRKLVFLTSMVALIVSVTLLIDFYFGGSEITAEPDYWSVNNDETGMAVVEIPPQSGNPSDAPIQIEILAKYKELWEKNKEMVGYVSVDPYINYPVVQPSVDKPYDFYLHHDFYGEPAVNGTVFVTSDVKHSPPTLLNTGRPDNIILHGHYGVSRNIFQPLTNYRDSFTFLQNHPVITFDTLYEPGRYRIFAVYQTNTEEHHGEYYDYWNKNNFSTADDFYEYVLDALDRSRYHTDVELRYGDELLTLSTCDPSMLSEIRLVVVARRERLNESEPMDVDSFVSLRTDGGKINGLMKYKMFDAFYKARNSGRGWAGRQWDTARVEGLDEYLLRMEQ